MYLTSDHQVGGKTMTGIPEDLSFIVRYSWQSSKHMKEAIKILLSARLDGSDANSSSRFEEQGSAEQREVQLRLASNPETSEEVLDFLRRIGDKDVCERIAINPRSPQQTLEALAEHFDADVRAALSENSLCPITVLYRLSKDEHPDVRLRMAENPNLPDSILEELCDDENPFVAARASESLRRAAGGTVIEGVFGTSAIRLKAVMS